MAKYKINQQVDATVERILPFGVFVRLDDGIKAYIRKRELDLDADIEPSQVTHEGEKIRAIVLTLGEFGKYIELSRRAILKDPWPEFAHQHHVGDIVRGTVRALQSHGAFVRIQAGIDGFVPLEELTTISVNKPEEVVWVGDNVEAIIGRIESEKRHISLSIKKRIRQYNQEFETSGLLVKKTTSELFDKTLQVGGENTRRIDSALYDHLGSILVVEDDKDVRDSLTTWLRRRKLNVTSVESVSKAKELQSSQYKIFIVDLNLLEDDGIQLIQHFRKQNTQLFIFIMSSPEELANRAKDIEVAQVTGVFPKPLDLDEIEQFLLRVAKNEQIPFWQASYQVRKPLNLSGKTQESEARPLDQLQRILQQTTASIGAQTGILFQLDATTHMISILVHIGKRRINPIAIYGLRESPVKDVIQEGEGIFENQVREQVLARFDKLQDLLSFQSCIGIPVNVQGENHHAAFYFHSDANAFSLSQMHNAQAGAFLIAATLTEESIQARLRTLNPMLLSGELAASFGHDVFNKITALELEARNLLDNSEASSDSRTQKILDLVLDLKNTVYAFQQMLRSKEQMETMDVNYIIKRSILLLRDFARKERVKIILKLLPDPTPVMGISTVLQQVFLNIMLNAIQQMALKAEKFEWTGQRILEITSSLTDNLLQIRFKDNGPGIHKEHLGKLFAPGFSTREGSGLGLYIARSFIQTLGGTLRVEETFVPLGTTFLVELPLITPEAKYD